MPIEVLIPSLAAQIAAGEVVERPVSVVKELIENSLDAHAASIVIDVGKDPCSYIRVVDDGDGISSNEIDLALTHHATSKLHTLDQLDDIRTLGFRGEALPSIASVSKVLIVSRRLGSDSAYSVEYDCGLKINETAYASAIGTSVSVIDLFSNVPVRLKFLRSSTSELTKVKDIVHLFAMAYPSVKFQLRIEGKVTFDTQGSGNPIDPIVAVYGPKSASEMIAVASEQDDNGYAVEGFVSVPALNRANRSYMSLFVNNRLVNSRMLNHAVEESYHGLLPERRYPISVLNLAIPYSDVDVNAHPGKLEVRFQNENRVYSTLQKAIRSHLINQIPVSQVGQTTFTNRASQSVYPYTNYKPHGTTADSQTTFSVDSAYTFNTHKTNREVLPSLTLIGQVRLTYLVADGPDGVYLIDQHAAHERILFDKIVAGRGQRQSVSQILLSPTTVELSSLHADLLDTNKETLKLYGFDIEQFGDNTYIVRAVPAVMSIADTEKSLRDILDMISVEGLLRQHEDVVAASVACHSSVRAGMPLSLTEMQSLLNQLHDTSNPHTCPHGRPTIIRYADYNLEREFGRRQ